jgi:hypothetical protein
VLLQQEIQQQERLKHKIANCAFLQTSKGFLDLSKKPF